MTSQAQQYVSNVSATVPKYLEDKVKQKPQRETKAGCLEVDKQMAKCVVSWEFQSFFFFFKYVSLQLVVEKKHEYTL